MTRVVACLMIAALARPTAAGPLDPVARLVSPAFAELDRRRTALLEAPPPFTPPPGRSAQLGYHSMAAFAADSPRWVQVDLGATRPIDTVVVIPATGPAGDHGPGYFFPTRFRVDLGDRPDLSDATPVADHTAADYPFAGDRPVILPAGGRSARYVRFTATRLTLRNGLYFFALGELLAVSGNLNAAAARKVDAANAIDNPPAWNRAFLVDGQSLCGPPLGPRLRDGSNGYHSGISNDPAAAKWVQVDLGRPLPLDEVRLIPARPTDFADQTGFGFPVRFKVEAANDEAFTDPTLLRDATDADVPNPGDGPVVIPVRDVTARYVRVTATKLWERTMDFVFALAELQVYSRGANVSVGAAVTARDSINRSRWHATYLVDGYASRYELLEWPAWVAQEQARADRAAEVRAVAARWEAARDAAYRAITWAAGGLGLAGTGLALAAAWRSRVHGRRAAEALRDRIARDLHDEVGSNIGSILLISQTARTHQADQVGKDLAEVVRIAQQTGDAMRDLVWLLGRPPDEAMDLLARMRETASGILAAVDGSFEAADDCLPKRLPLAFKREVFLSFKEILHNAARHSGATRVTVACRRDGNRFVLTVCDNGKGFDPNRSGGGMGMRSLRARAAALDAKLDVDSAPGRGTTVRLSVPL